MESKCEQYGKPMSQLEVIVMGPVCGVCCRRNHRAVVNGTSGPRRQTAKYEFVPLKDYRKGE